MDSRSVKDGVTGELWQIVHGQPDFEVSTLGRVRSYRSGSPRVMKGTRNPRGYVYVNMRSPGCRRREFIHRLVAEAFLPNWDGSLHVNHIDGVKENNRLDNLQCVTPKENIAHAFRTGLLCCGSRHPLAKLNESNVLSIWRARGTLTRRELASQYGVSVGTIALIWQRKKWRHVTDNLE